MHLGDYGCPVLTKELSFFVQDYSDMNRISMALNRAFAQT